MNSWKTCSGRGHGLAGKRSLKDAEMELLNEIKQFGADAGAHKGLAVPAGRLHKP